MQAAPAQLVEMIPIDEIAIVNPRSRNQRIFKEIIDNIAAIGLKRPITVSRRRNRQGLSEHYELVCGQGRLEAFRALGETDVPALVVAAETEDCLIASLVENCARRQHKAIDLLEDISGMSKRGHSTSAIAEKTGLSFEYVSAVTKLLNSNEHRLLNAVEAGHIPFSVALDIAESEEDEVQTALQNAYEQNLLRGRKLLLAKRVVQLRRRRGGHLPAPKPQTQPMSSSALVKAYQEDAERKRMLIRSAQAARNRLIFIAEALQRLVADEDFRAILVKEGLTTLPESLAKRLARPSLHEAVEVL